MRKSEAEEIVRLARKGLDARQIVERMSASGDLVSQLDVEDVEGMLLDWQEEQVSYAEWLDGQEGPDHEDY